MIIPSASARKICKNCVCELLRLQYRDAFSSFATFLVSVEVTHYCSKTRRSKEIKQFLPIGR